MKLELTNGILWKMMEKYFISGNDMEIVGKFFDNVENLNWNCFEKFGFLLKKELSCKLYFYLWNLKNLWYYI